MNKVFPIPSSLNLENLQKRQKNALIIEKALHLAQQGKNIDLSQYLKTLKALQEVAAKNKATLQNRNIQIPHGFKEKFTEHEKLIQRIESIARTIQKTESELTQPSLPSTTKFPWEGNLRKGETPLHWAVRHHEHGWAWHLALQNHPSITVVDDLGVSPIDEAVLQKDSQMVELLLHPWFVSDPRAMVNFQNQIHAIQTQLEKMRQVDVSSLSPACRAAYEGTLDPLKEEHQNFLDSPDPKTGLTPLHYAILGGQEGVIQFLIANHPNLHFLTPKGHSYLDYAILMGNGLFFGLFNNVLNLPFRLARQEEIHSYLIATGTLDSYLKWRAAMRDPIGGGGKDQNLFGMPLNAAWATSKVLSKAMGTSSWLGSVFDGIGSWSYVLNRYTIGQNQLLALLPAWAGVAFGIYGLSQFGVVIGSSLGRLIPQFLIPTSFTNAASTITSLTNMETMQTALKIASHTYTGLRFIGAVKPVLNRIPAYWRTFPSRKFEVLKKVGLDLFNIGSQLAMSLVSPLSNIPPAAVPAMT